MLRFLRKVKLKQQLLLLISISLLFMILIEGFYYVSISTIIQNRAKVYADNMINQIIEKMDTSNREVERVTESLSFNKYLQLYLTAESAELKLPYSQILSEMLPNFSTTNEQISSISLIDLNGIKTGDYSLPLTLLENIEAHYDIYKKQANIDTFTNIFLEPITGNYNYAYVKSVYWSQENTNPFDKIGTCIVQLSTELLQSNLQGLNLTPNSEFLILDAANHIVASNNPAVKTGTSLPGDLNNFMNEASLKFNSQFNSKDVILQSKSVSATGWKVVSIIPVSEINDDLKPVRYIGAVLVLLFSGLSIMLGIIFNRNITRPISTLIHFLNRSDLHSHNRKLPSYERNEIGELYIHINNMLVEIRSITHQMIDTQSSLYEMELAKKQAELSALISQINPHFLYNTLDSLKGIGYHYKSQEIVKITECLSDILRYSIKGSETVQVNEELKCVRNYLTIIAIRFGTRFQFEWDIEERITQLNMTKFIIQPVVENAIYHGLEPKLEIGTLRIKGELLDANLCFTISDSGLGIPPDELAAIRTKLKESTTQGILAFGDRGIGILNIHHRIQLMHGTEYGIQIESTANNGTIVRIVLPAL